MCLVLSEWWWMVVVGGDGEGGGGMWGWGVMVVDGVRWVVGRG